MQSGGYRKVRVVDKVRQWRSGLKATRCSAAQQVQLRERNRRRGPMGGKYNQERYILLYSFAFTIASTPLCFFERGKTPHASCELRVAPCKSEGKFLSAPANRIDKNPHRCPQLPQGCACGLVLPMLVDRRLSTCTYPACLHVHHEESTM